VILNENKIAFTKWVGAPFTTCLEILTTLHSIEEAQQKELMKGDQYHRAHRPVPHHLLDDAQREGLLVLFAGVIVLVPF